MKTSTYSRRASRQARSHRSRGGDHQPTVYSSEEGAFRHEVRSQLVHLNGRVDTLDRRIDGLDRRMDGLEHRMDGLEHRIGVIETNTEQLGQRLSKVEADVSEVKGIVKGLQHSMTMMQWIGGVLVTLSIGATGLYAGTALKTLQESRTVRTQHIGTSAPDEGPDLVTVLVAGGMALVTAAVLRPHLPPLPWSR